MSVHYPGLCPWPFHPNAFARLHGPSLQNHHRSHASSSRNMRHFARLWIALSCRRARTAAIGCPALQYPHSCPRPDRRTSQGSLLAVSSRIASCPGTSGSSTVLCLPSNERQLYTNPSQHRERTYISFQAVLGLQVIIEHFQECSRLSIVSYLHELYPYLVCFRAFSV